MFVFANTLLPQFVPADVFFSTKIGSWICRPHSLRCCVLGQLGAGGIASEAEYTKYDAAMFNMGPFSGKQVSCVPSTSNQIYAYVGPAIDHHVHRCFSMSGQLGVVYLRLLFYPLYFFLGASVHIWSSGFDMGH